MDKYGVYLRVSKDKQDTERQKILVNDWLERNKIENYEIFEEKESSRGTRPIKYDLYYRTLKGEFQGVIVARLDRWARDTKEMLVEVDTLVKNGRRFVAIMNLVDFHEPTFDPVQRMNFILFSMIAEFEYNAIRQRSMERQQQVKKQGKHIGRKKGSRDKKPRKRKYKKAPSAIRKNLSVGKSGKASNERF